MSNMSYLQASQASCRPRRVTAGGENPSRVLTAATRLAVAGRGEGGGVLLLPGRPRHQRPSRQCSGTRQRRGQQRPGLGLAGYDPRHQHMRGVLIAKGPGGHFQQTSIR